MLIFFCPFCCSGRFYSSIGPQGVPWWFGAWHFLNKSAREFPPQDGPLTSYKWDNLYNWPCKWATRLITPLVTGFLNLSIAGRGPSVPCIHSSSFFVASCRHLLQQTVGALSTFSLLLDCRVLGLKFFEMGKLCQGILGNQKSDPLTKNATERHQKKSFLTYQDFYVVQGGRFLGGICRVLLTASAITFIDAWKMNLQLSTHAATS